MDIIADALLAGDAVDFMSIDAPQDLQKILQVRGVDIENQVYVDENGALAVVDNLDDIWFSERNGAGNLALSQDFDQAVSHVASSAELATVYGLSEGQLEYVRTEVDALRGNIDDDVGARREELYHDDIYKMIIDEDHPSHETAVNASLDNLNVQKNGIENQFNARLEAYPEAYRRAVIREESAYYESAMSELYDLVEPFVAKLDEAKQVAAQDGLDQNVDQPKNSWESLYDM